VLLEFGVKNFRSIKDEAVFSLIANDNESKPANVFTHKLATGEEIRLLKSAAIFGPNASGKTAVLQGFYTFIQIILFNNINVGDEIGYYNSFKFNLKTKEQPVSFWMSFIGPNDYRYIYSFSFDQYNIVNEKLEYNLNGLSKNSTIVLSRIIKKDEIHLGKLGENFGEKEIQVFHNQLFLSRFGKDNPHKFITPIFTYLYKYNVVNTLNDQMLSFVEGYLVKKIKNDFKFKNKLENLIRIADTKLNRIAIKDFLLVGLNKKNGNLNSDMRNEERIEIIHKVYENKLEVDEDTLDLYDESSGTQQSIIIGGMILDYLEKAGILFIDELDSSLHPLLVQSFIHLVQSEKLNPKNAQVVFTTHDINVLNQNIFRKDQYWFTEKNEFGETELFSLQDFDEVSEDTPFSSWYMAGRFGAIPNIQSIEKILGGEE